MRKFLIAMNFISIVLFFTILLRIDLLSGITGFATAASKSNSGFQAPIIIPIIFVFITLVVNLYFFFKERDE